MKVVNMGNIADAFRFDNLPATGIVIEATPKELKLLPNLAYKDVTISEHVSNAAAMREALEKVRFYLPYFLQYMRLNREDEKAGGYYESILEVVSAALSAPPRNCDRFATLDDARNAFFEDYVPDETCSSANAFAIWLFDEAKGGAS